MRKILVVVVMGLLITQGGFAQLKKKPGKQNLKVRHSLGVKSFDIGGGVSGYGVLGTAYFSEFLRDNVFYKVGGGYEFKASRTNTTKYSSLFGDVLVGYTVLDKGTLFINGLGGVTGAMDNLTGIQTDKNIKGGVFGGVIGGEIECYFANNIVFAIIGTQRLIITKENSDRWYLTASLRVKL